MLKLIHIFICLLVICGCTSQSINTISQNDPLSSEVRRIRTKIVIQKGTDGRYMDIGEIRRDLDQTETLFKDLNIRFDIDKVEVWDYQQNVTITGGRIVAGTTPEYLTIFFWQMYCDAAILKIPFSIYSTFLAGVSSFPWEKHPHGIFVFQGHSNPYTLAHEIGHYFGLHHTFNSGGDEIADTKDTDDPAYCNLMNYHECGSISSITQGQIDRMRFYLLYYRKDIIK